MIKDDNKKRLENIAVDRLVGRRIVGVSYMPEAEVRQLGWAGSPLLVELDDRTILYASSDDEGNGPGALHGIDKGNKGFLLPVLS